MCIRDRVRENNIVFCQNLIVGVAELRQIILVHCVHKAVDDLLRFHIGGDIGSDGDQPVSYTHLDYTEGEGWHDARIVPYGPFELDPATVVFHYAQEILSLIHI